MFKATFLFIIFIVSLSAFSQEVPAVDPNWMADLASKYPLLLVILSAIGLIVTVAQAVIWITPTKKDDLWLEGAKKSWYWKIVSMIENFAPVKKK